MCVQLNGRSGVRSHSLKTAPCSTMYITTIASAVSQHCPKWGGEFAGDDDGDEDDESDDDVDTLAQRLCDRLAGAEERMGRFREWLSVSHDLAASLAQQQADVG